MHSKLHNNHIASAKALAVTFVLLIVVIGVSLWARYIENDVSDRLADIAAIKSQLTITFSLLQDAETGQRGYLITQEQEYLAPYLTAIKRISAALDHLAQLTADSPALSNRVAMISELAGEKLQELALTIHLAQTQSIEQAAEVVHTNLGRQLMDSVRTHISDLHAIEDHAYRNQMAQLDRVGQWRLMSDVVVFLLFVFAALYVTRFYKLLGLLQKERSYLNAVLEYAPVGIVLVDGGGVIESANEEFSKILGETKGGIAGRSLASYFPKQHLGAILNSQEVPTNQTESARYPFRCEQKALGRRGRLVPVEVLVDKAQIGETDVRFVVIVNDITEQKKAHDLIKNQNLELQNFAYVCSHDLQEPLRMISMYSGELKKQLPSGVLAEESLARYMDYVVDGAVRAQNLVRDLLSFSRLEYQTNQLELVDTAELLDSVVAVQDLLESNQIGLNVKRNELPVVRGHQTILYQLFQNIISNAVKYQSKERALAISVTASDQIACWQFAIQDNGIGIDKRHFDKIFVIFKRLHHQNEYPGTGIGLAICKKIVEIHGGKMWAESTVGEGSTFFFTLKKVQA
ncbi:hypothetical protein GCM10025791_29350 [Halioxenophilus aromaticivorans]|uniref:histidine kinase n=2 Tax=Halioxenophilus aromaticivorans TaxID=1306992 RepID=A0AAV3U539_9ALTE